MKEFIYFIIVFGQLLFWLWLKPSTDELALQTWNACLLKGDAMKPKKTFRVRLNVPTVVWAIVEVEATCPEDAVKQAFEQNAKGMVSYESSGYDHTDAELTDVEELQ